MKTITLINACMMHAIRRSWFLNIRAPVVSQIFWLEECSGNAPDIFLEFYRDFITTKSIPNPYPVSTFLELGCPIPETSASRDGVPG